MDKTEINETVYGDKVAGDKVAGDKVEIEQYVEKIIIQREAVESIEDLPPEKGDPPYLGLQYFDVDDTSRFFGREKLTAQIINRLHHTRFLAIVGASGSGKSSLLRAGVVDAIQKGQPLQDGTLPPNGRWAVRVIKPTAAPLDQLAMTFVEDKNDFDAFIKLQEQLSTNDKVLPFAARRLITAEGSDNLLLAVDQFEEIFTLCKDEAQRAKFVELLLKISAPESNVPVTVVLTLRADFYAECGAYEELRLALSGHQEYIGAMNRQEMGSAIYMPLFRSDQWEIQEGLAETILDELGQEPGALALLSHLLLEMWKRRRGHVLTLSGYNEAGGVREAISKTAEDIYCSHLTEEQRPIARNIFARLTELGAQDTRRRARRQELFSAGPDPALVESVIATLTNARLVVIDSMPNSDEETVEVTHESLIRHWPRLRAWLKEDRGLLELRQTVQRAAVEWLANSRKESYLVHLEERLKQVVVLLTHPRVTLDEDEQDYLEACQKLDSKAKASISEMGWGVIFAAKADPAVREALSELLDHRRKQATEDGLKPDYYREFTGGDGYRPDETKSKFLGRHGVGASLPTPDQMPYYLLIVGDPETIPFSFQYQLDMQYAVGRIYFDELEGYARYARSVVTAESTELTLPQRAVVFAPQNEGDRATEMSLERLAKPIADTLEEKQDTWQIERHYKEEATKDRLSQLIGGKETAALLFTCGHGMQFTMDNERQLADQGAILCQDWPGPQKWQGDIDKGFYFSSADVAEDANLLGSIVYFWSCYGAATPKMDNFSQQSFQNEPQQIAPNAFIASLPQRLLGHPKGGALAVIGSVERKWGYSFAMGKGVNDLNHFLETLEKIMDGFPVGVAMEAFNQRYASLMSELVSLLERSQTGQVDPYTMAQAWTSTNDARNYIILGDPAVRLRVGEGADNVRPVIESVPEIIDSGSGFPSEAQKPGEPLSDRPGTF